MERLESEGETVPIMYFPNKPHKEGLLIYQWMRRHLSTMEKKYPYIIDMFPYLEPPVVSPQNTVRRMMERWPYNDRPHIVADRAFGSLELLQDIINWGWKSNNVNIRTKYSNFITNCVVSFARNKFLESCEKKQHHYHRNFTCDAYRLWRSN
jgi:hypothetical protein